MRNLLMERIEKVNRRIAEFEIGDTIIITQSPKYKGQRAILTEKNGAMFKVKMRDGSIREYSMSAVKKDSSLSTQEEIDVILKVSEKCGCDTDGDILKLFVHSQSGIVQPM